MSACKYCHAEIIWIKMRSGKYMPCNTGKIPYRQSNDGNMNLVTENGNMISAFPCTDMEGAEGIGYVSHYATCPGTERIRRR